jgi:membrane protease YdiL (CAAX protease family)
MRPQAGMKLLAVFLFFLLIGWMVYVFSASAGAMVYPLMMLLSIFFILFLKLKVPLDGIIQGVVAAVVPMGLIVAALWLIGAIKFGAISGDFLDIFMLGVVIQLLVSFGEELSFRASIFQGLQEVWGLWPAAILSAVGFAILHLPSMGKVGMGTEYDWIALGTITLAGIALALLYYYGGLFNAIAFHFTWNFMEYNLFDLGPLDGAIAVIKTGPDILTGGAFGPEASVLTLAVTALLVAAIWLYYNRLRKKKENSLPLPD